LLGRIGQYPLVVVEKPQPDSAGDI
jgi:hypothetical protein